MAASNSSNVPDSTNQISDAEDTNMFQAARRSGRRNALPDLGEHLFQRKTVDFHFVLWN